MIKKYWAVFDKSEKDIEGGFLFKTRREARDYKLIVLNDSRRWRVCKLQITIE